MKREKSKGLLMLIVCLMALLLSIPVSAIAADGVIYGSDGITRAEWLHNLVVMFDMTVEEGNYPDNYFGDIASDYQYYEDIMKTVEFGVVDIPAGGNVEPDTVVTREFAAHTLNYCLGYDLGENPAYTMSDADKLTYPQDAQVAVNREWFVLVGGAFSGDTAVTSEEMKKMEQDVKEILASTEIEEDHKNVYEYAPGVVIVPAGAEIAVDENNTVTIYDPNIKIVKGDSFVVYLNGIPQAYIAQEVTAGTSQSVIATSPADVQKVFENIDAQGIVEADLTLARPAEGLDIVYIEGGTEALAYTDGIEYIDVNLARTKKINAIKIKKTTIPLGQGVSAEVSCTISNISISYNVNLLELSSYISCEGHMHATGAVKANAVGMMGSSGQIPLMTVPVGGIGSINVYAFVRADGKLTLTYDTNFKASVQHSVFGGFRTPVSFKKSHYTLVGEVNLGVGVRAEANVKVPFVQGQIYAEAGAKAEYRAETFDDGNLPNLCASFRGWMYAEAGASVTVDYILNDKTFSAPTMNILNYNNSPVRLVYHWEDGKRVRRCTRDGSEWYSTSYDSPYGNPGDGYGFNEDGEFVPVFTYEVVEDDIGNKTASITGYTGKTYALDIPEEIDGYTVTSIGRSAFENREDLYVVTIPDTVTKIDADAFWGCVNLEQVELSNSLVELEDRAFGKCTNLGSIYIPKSLMTAGYFYGGPFVDCSSLDDVSFEPGRTVMPAKLFANCTGLTKIAIPDTIITIEDEAFTGCINLENVFVPNSVTSIGDNAFSDCSKMERLVLSDSVTEIGNWAFSNCEMLSDVVMSKNLTTMKNGSFKNCDSLTSIYIPRSLVQIEAIDGGIYGGPFMDCDSLETIIFEEGRTSITEFMFDHCSGLREIVIPNTVVTIEKYAFKASGVREIIIPDKVTDIGFEAFYNCKSLTNVVLSDSVAKIDQFAFADCINLKEITMSKGLTVLRDCVFENCTSLTAIDIPKSLTKIDVLIGGIYGGPFVGCSALNTIRFEEGRTVIPQYLFDRCTGLEELDIPDTVTQIGEGAFIKCSNLRRVAIPEKVTRIDAGAFEECSKLTSIEIPNPTAVLGNNIFTQCSSLTVVQLPKELKQLSAELFSECTSLKEITIPENVTLICDGAFSGAGINSLKIPEKVTTIEKNVFRDCISLNQITLNNGLETLGNYAFYGCDALTSIELPNTVTSIGTYCFADSDLLADVKLSTGLTEIPSYAFHQCVALESIILPYRVKKIYANAFTNCTKLAEITIPRAATTIADNVFSYPEKLTISGREGSYAQTYAESNGIKFKGIDKPAETVSLNKEELTGYLGAAGKLILTVEPMDFTDEVNWKSSDTDVVTVDENGVIKGVGVGTATIKVTVGNLSASCTVTVEQPVTYLHLNKTALSLDAFATEQLTIRMGPDSAVNKEIEWSSSDENVATVDASGLVTAVAKGTAIITVKALGGVNVSENCEVTVTGTGHIAESAADLESAHDYAADTTDIWLYTSPDVPDALEVTFDAQTNIEDGFDYLYIYDGQGNEIGKYTGTVLAGQTVTVPGDTLKIRLVSDAGGTAWGFRVTSIVPVDSEKQQQEITGSNAYDKVYGDAAFALDAVLAVGDGELSYESDNTKVADVDQNGNVTITGAGNANITVTASATADYRMAQKVIAITVSKAEQKLELIYAGTTLCIGEEMKISATSSTGDITFSSDNDEVASVTGDGMVTAKAAGYANITVYSAGGVNYNDAQQMIALVVYEKAEDSVDLADCTVTLDRNSFVYDGTAKEPEVTVSYEGITLLRGVDYEVSYENNINPGEAVVKVTALPAGRYTGTATSTFTIRKELPENATEVEPYAFSSCDTLYNVKFQNTITKIGDHAFADCKNLTELCFYGHAPEIGAGAFEHVTATAYYPAADGTWTLDKLTGYGGNITWVPWNPSSGTPAKRSLTICTLQVANGTYTYDGTAKTPAVTVTDGSRTLVNGVDYTVSYTNNVNAGTASVQASGAGTYEGTLSATFKIAKAEPVLAFADKSLTKSYGASQFLYALKTAVTDGNISYASDNIQVLEVSSITAAVTVRGVGTATITAKAAEGKNYRAGSASCVVTVGKAENTITVKDITKTYSKKAQSVKIGANVKGGAKLTYSSDNKSVKVSTSGKITIAKKFIGTAKISISAQETANYKAARCTITVAVNPKGVSLKKLRNDAGKKMTVTWKKNSDVTGYEIQYSTNKKFASGVKKKSVSKYKTTSLKLSGLKKGKTYYVRIRTYKTVKGKKYYSVWSKAKSVKIKK